MRRATSLIVAGAWLVAIPAAAQVSLGRAEVPGITVTRNTPPAPSPQPATPPPSAQHPIAGRPMVPTGGGPMVPIGGDQFLANPLTYAPRYRTRGWRNDRLNGIPGYGNGFGYSSYGPGYVPYVGVETPYPQEPEGRLFLRVIPGTAQVFVDGLYVGVADDFSGSGLSLGAGPRRVELRADGYETVTFDVRIVPGETVNYRKDLARMEARPEAPRVAAIPKTFYVIPRCYAGDTRPQAEDLPRGCRVANLRTVPPVVGAPSARR